MTVNCPFLYINGVRVLPENVIVHVPLEDGTTAPAGIKKTGTGAARWDDSGETKRPVVTTPKDLRKIVARGEKIRVTVKLAGGVSVETQLDPYACEGRKARKNFATGGGVWGNPYPYRSAAEVESQIAAEQLRTLPYGDKNWKEAHERITWALEHAPDGTIGKLLESPGQEHIAGYFAKEENFDELVENRRWVDLFALRKAAEQSEALLWGGDSATITKRVKELYLGTYSGEERIRVAQMTDDPETLRELLEWEASALRGTLRANGERWRHDWEWPKVMVSLIERADHPRIVDDVATGRLGINSDIRLAAVQKTENQEVLWEVAWGEDPDPDRQTYGQLVRYLHKQFGKAAVRQAAAARITDPDRLEQLACRGTDDGQGIKPAVALAALSKITDPVRLRRILRDAVERDVRDMARDLLRTLDEG